MTSLTKIAGTVLGTAAIAAISTAKAGAVFEIEPNNTFPGQSATLGTPITGALCQGCLIFPVDTIDFFHYTALPPGTFDLTFDPLSAVSLRAGLYTDQTTSPSFVDSAGPLVHLIGPIPASGELTFGITENGIGFEAAYSLVLNTTRVPEPPAIALLAVGLTALALDVARRRKPR